ncbi:hypothetical protein F8M41_006211 [Gigaspora margarita]|uniref:Uncharacterized protein n=1 Tax=Gigaspora margarita TaxID=4874 RepID=A0A8H3X8U5_GIGMA|nr:hypothetical protein F8M41_006211 [Gigaspora margarita]
MNIHQNTTNKVSENNPLKQKSKKFDNMNSTKDNNINDIEDYQPKTEEPVQTNQDSKTNNKDRGGSGKNGKCLT